MLDALASLGLVANVVQFIEFSCKLFSDSLDFYRSGASVTRETNEVTIITEQLQDLCKLLSVSSDKPEQKDTGIEVLARNCKDAGDELLAVLQSLRSKGRPGKWVSFRIMLATSWKKGEIEAMVKRLESYKTQTILYLTFQIEEANKQRHTAVLELISRLKSEDRKLGTNMSAEIASLKADMLHFMDELKEQLKQQGSTTNKATQSNRFSNGIERSARPSSATFSHSKVSDMSASERKMTSSFEILKSLQYEMMEYRHSAISIAHTNTFQWIFSSRFSHWLRTPGSIYWITGKPGCGKSTLIKKLIDHPETLRELRKWSGTKGKLVVASHFFWAAGTELQKSQDGLLRSLLFESLRQAPELIPYVASAKWQHKMHSAIDVHSESWTHQELLEAFSKLGYSHTFEVRFCFFVDGLDEYNGDPTELIQLFQNFSRLSSVKLCLSSRPWNVFEAAFGEGQVWKVYLQDVNRADIELYVKDKIKGHPEFQRLARRDPRCLELVREIVDKSKGVFLWVRLVVRSLFSGLQNSDRVLDLQRRVRDFPSDLYDFFLHIFNSLDLVYRVQVARAFRVALTSARPLLVLDYWNLDREEEKSNFVFEMSVEELSFDEAKERIDEMQKRLNGRSKGLLEVVYPSRKVFNFADSTTELKDVNRRVEFLHRTVRDFLLTAEMQKLLTIWTPSGFEPNTTICKLLLARMKVKITRGDSVVPFGAAACRNTMFVKKPDGTDLIDIFFHHARQVELVTKTPPIRLIQELDAQGIMESEDLARKRTRGSDKKIWTCNQLLEAVVHADLQLYLAYRLNDPSASDEKLCPMEATRLLDCALNHVPSMSLSANHDNCIAPSVPVVALLLRSGADPNHEHFDHGSTIASPYTDDTIWSRLLGTMLTYRPRSPNPLITPWERQLCFELLNVMIQHGAELRNRKSGISSRIFEPLQIIRTILPEDTNDLVGVRYGAQSGNGRSDKILRRMKYIVKKIC